MNIRCDFETGARFAKTRWMWKMRIEKKDFCFVQFGQ